MKALLLPLAACAALAGCATYGDPYGYSHPTTVYPATGVYQTMPGYTYGTYGAPSGYYGSGSYPVYQDDRRGMRGRDRDRDRDRDGIPNRVDRDRDGDGVPNERDARPNNPRRY
jgi:hypothetical protein